MFLTDDTQNHKAKVLDTKHERRKRNELMD